MILLQERSASRTSCLPRSGRSGTARLTIDLAALVANYRLVARHVAPSEVGAVVKADAYGLGAGAISLALSEAGCRHFFVAHLEEAEALPELPEGTTVFVLNGLVPGMEPECVAVGAIPVLNSADQVQRWTAEAVRRRRRLPAALQLDSGMARLGLHEADVLALRNNASLVNALDLRLVMSHYACADDPAAASNEAQQRSFERLSRLLPDSPRSLANSGGAFLSYPPGDVVRIGIGLYGGAPHSAAPNPFQPVLTLHATIIQLRRLPAGAGIGYGLTGATNHQRRIAIVNIGYADGWPRQLGGLGHAFVAGHRVPIVGRVSMDSMAIDVTENPDELVGPGVEVELIGANQTIDQVASSADTIAHELLTRMGSRLTRVYSNAPSDLAVR